jgi:hypothetical protein
MPPEDEMTATERRNDLKKMKPLYARVERTEQSRMLTEMEQVTGLHRTGLLRLVHAPTLERKKRVKGRPAHPPPAHLAGTVRVLLPLSHFQDSSLSPGHVLGRYTNASRSFSSCSLPVNASGLGPRIFPLLPCIARPFFLHNVVSRNGLVPSCRAMSARRSPLGSLMKLIVSWSY